MPKASKAKTAAATTPTATTTETTPAEKKGKDKERGAPKASPPKSIVQRIARKKAGGKGFQAASYELVRDLVVKYVHNVFEQDKRVLINRKGKTLTPRDLKVLAGIAQTASTTPEKAALGAAVQEYETQI